MSAINYRGAQNRTLLSNNILYLAFVSMFLISVLMSGCQGGDQQSGDTAATEEKDAQGDNFLKDLSFLQKWDAGLLVLSSDDGAAKVIVSPKYQGKVFTSASEGSTGKSFGWIHYDAFDKPVDPHMNAYGGEDRLWLGPEGGPFSLFFAPGTEMVFDNWHTPKPIDTEAWSLVASSDKEAQLSKDMSLVNYAGTTLKLNIDRTVRILQTPEIAQKLSIDLDDKIHPVGFETTNTLKNTGDIAWDRKTGAPCMWNLDMFTPSPATVIVIPYDTNAQGKVATTDYFGEIPKDRIKMENGILYFMADGHSRGKLGIPPVRVKDIAGSYAADKGVLTIIQYDIDKNGTYLNQEWTTTKDPFSGDAMNAYNDGPLEDGSQMGPFYEMESVSPAAFLKPNEALVHKHSVFHFTGDKDALNAIAEKVLGVGLEKISGAFGEK